MTDQSTSEVSPDWQAVAKALADELGQAKAAMLAYQSIAMQLTEQATANTEPDEPDVDVDATKAIVP